MNRNDQQFLAQKIRAQYTEQKETELDELKRADAAVKRPADVFAYMLGSAGALMMGAGMSLVMTDLSSKLGIASAMPIGIAMGVVGLTVAIVNYPIYKRILGKRRQKYADKIIALSDKMMKG